MLHIMKRGVSLRCRLFIVLFVLLNQCAWIISSSSSSSTITNASSDDSSNVTTTRRSHVEIYDNVLSSSTRLLLHQECAAWDREMEKTQRVFVFPLVEASTKPKSYSIMEQVLNSILWQLYPDTKSRINSDNDSDGLYYVEYWQRQGWYHILAHADMDEGLREEQERAGLQDEAFSHPDIGHVLYLKIGSKVRGPTCVWGNNITHGGQMLSSTISEDDSIRKKTKKKLELTIVPAVESRLLRFPGHLLHGVPRPADVYMSPAHETEQSHDSLRSVLLFNLWPIQNGRLRGRSIQTPSSTTTRTSTSSTDTTTTTTTGTDTPLSCHDMEEWKQIMVHNMTTTTTTTTTSNDPFKTIQFPLMGDERRRGTKERSVVMQTLSSSRQGFWEPWQPTRIWIEPKIKKKQTSKKAWFTFMGVEF